jgi:hypothetical protein
VRLKGAAAKTHECSYSATFVDGAAVGPVPSGETCEAESLAALEAFQVTINRRGAGAAPGGAPRGGRARAAQPKPAETTAPAAKPTAPKGRAARPAAAKPATETPPADKPPARTARPAGSDRRTR